MSEDFIKAQSKQDSIKVARNAKGDYSWEVKLYFENEKEDYKETLTRVDNIVEELKQRY